MQIKHLLVGMANKHMKRCFIREIKIIFTVRYQNILRKMAEKRERKEGKRERKKGKGKRKGKERETNCKC